MRGTPINLIRILAVNGPIPPGRWLMVALYFLRSVLMVPLSLTEKIFLSKRIQSTKVLPPVFIIGHYRSGTTFLHKVMTADPQFAYINTYNIFFPFSFNCVEKILKRILQGFFNLVSLKQIHYHDYKLNLDDPLEEDLHMLISICSSSAFLMEVFPRNAAKYIDRNILFMGRNAKDDWLNDYMYCLKRFTYKSGGRRLILKNPPNTARIKTLLQLFPDSKFIFIYRNPYQVYYSTRNLWKNVIEKYYSLHKISSEENDDIIFSYYTLIMTRFMEDRWLIPEGNLVEVRYEDFEKDPFGETERIYRELNITGFAEASGHILKCLEKEKKYTKFSYNYGVKDMDKIYQHWGSFIDEWKYERLEDPVKHRIKSLVDEI